MRLIFLSFYGIGTMRKLTAEQKKRLKEEWKNLINKGMEFPRVWEIDDNTFNNI